MNCKCLSSLRVALVVLVVPTWTRGDGPSTRPSSDGTKSDSARVDGPRGERPRGPGPGRGMGGPNGPMRGAMDDGKEATSDEIAKAEMFLKDYSPNRYSLYASIPQTRVYLLRNLRNRMVKQYRRMMEMKTQQPDMYDAMITEQKLVDDAIGYMIDQRAGKEGAEDKLKAKVMEIVENQLRERKSRIEKLEKMLAEQKEQLSRDEARKDDLAGQRRDQLERDIRIPPVREDGSKDDKSETPDGTQKKPPL